MSISHFGIGKLPSRSGWKIVFLRFCVVRLTSRCVECVFAPSLSLQRRIDFGSSGRDSKEMDAETFARPKVQDFGNLTATSPPDRTLELVGLQALIEQQKEMQNPRLCCFPNASGNPQLTVNWTTHRHRMRLYQALA